MYDSVHVKLFQCEHDFWILAFGDRVIPLSRGERIASKFDLTYYAIKLSLQHCTQSIDASVAL